MPDLVTVQLDTVSDLATRLHLLGEELDVDVEVAKVIGGRLGAGLSGPAVWHLDRTGLSWSTLLAALADQAKALAATLLAAVLAYRQLDDALTELLVGPLGSAAIAR